MINYGTKWISQFQLAQYLCPNINRQSIDEVPGHIHTKSIVSTLITWMSIQTWEFDFRFGRHSFRRDRHTMLFLQLYHSLTMLGIIFTLVHHEPARVLLSWSGWSAVHHWRRFVCYIYPIYHYYCNSSESILESTVYRYAPSPSSFYTPLSVIHISITYLGLISYISSNGCGHGETTTRMNRKQVIPSCSSIWCLRTSFKGLVCQKHLSSEVTKNW